MKHTKMVARKACAAAVMAACASGALAFEFETESGWRGSLNTTITASSAWRVEGSDKLLISPADAVAAGLVAPAPVAGNNPATAYASGAAQAAAYAQGYRGGSNTDSSNINFANGDRYSTLLKFVSDLEMKKDDMGGMIRVKGWYDQFKNKETVPFGHENTDYAGLIGSATATTARPARPLSDETFSGLNRFDGLYLLDAYVYSGFSLGDNPGQVRIGRQAINWGESLYIQGINQISPLDLTALRAAGTEIKEALLPIWAISANLGLSDGMSLDAFYQFKWEPSVIDSCGTGIWATAEGFIGQAPAGSSKCDLITSFGGNNGNVYNNTSALAPIYGAISATGLYAANGGVGAYPTRGKGGNLKDDKGSDSGQYGVSLRFPVDSIDTEFALYYTRLNARLPTVSLITPSLAGIKTAQGLTSVPFLTALLTPALGAAAGPTATALAPLANASGASTVSIFNGLTGSALAPTTAPAVAMAASMAAGGATPQAIAGALIPVLTANANPAISAAAAAHAATIAGTAVTNARAYAGAAATATPTVYAQTLAATQALAGAPTGATLAAATAANVLGAASIAGQVAGINGGKTLVAGNTMGGYWAYQDGIDTFAVSAATTMGGISWGAELSHQRNVPVQINGNDVVVGTLAYGALRSAGLPVATIQAMAAAGTAGLGPMGVRIAAAGDGGYVRGYDLFNKTQLQVNGVGTLPAMLGATNGLVIGEVAAQWNNIPKSDGRNVRYGRGFIFGQGESPLFGGALAALTGPYANCANGAATGAAGVAQTSTDGCSNDGFVTDFAWAYRLRASLDYPGFMDTSWTFTPSLFFAHDVEGHSMDFQFNEGRKTLSVGLKFDLQKTHKFELNYTTYSNSAKFDNTRDRDNASIVYSYTF